MVKTVAAAAATSSAAGGIVSVAKSANLAVSFALELFVLAAVGYWGYQTGNSTATRWVLAIGAPAAFITLWALFGAPDAKFTLSPTGKLIFQLVWYAAGGALLAATGQVRMALIFVAAAVASTILAIVWHQ